MPFISQGTGWGVRSSKKLGYLGSMPYLTFRKGRYEGFLNRECLPAMVSLALSRAFIIDSNPSLEAEEKDALSYEASLLLNLDLSLNNILGDEVAYFDDRGEDPNIASDKAEGSLTLEDLDADSILTFNWTIGFVNDSFFSNEGSEKNFYKLFYSGRLVTRV